jgi:predicted  nucleic acid-binding Zn-ribbon protein
MNSSSNRERIPDMPTEIAKALLDINKRINEIEMDLLDQKRLDILIDKDIQRILDERTPLSKSINFSEFKDKHLDNLREDKRASLKRAKQRLVELKNDIELAFSS